MEQRAMESKGFWLRKQTIWNTNLRCNNILEVKIKYHTTLKVEWFSRLGILGPSYEVPGWLMADVKHITKTR